MKETWIYGIHAITAALRYEPTRLRGLWVERQRQRGRIQAVLDEALNYGIAIHEAERTELDRKSGNAHHQGIVACMTVEPSRHDESDLPTLLAAAAGPALLLALDGVQDPHNLGACLRSAAAAGVDAVIAPADRAVGLNATVRKVACGAADIVPFVQVVNLARTLRALQEQGVWVIGATGEAAASLYEIDLTPPTAIVLGAEEKGLRRLTRDVCDRLVAIPMAESGVESLNVSVATGIFLFEARRQRSIGN